MALPTRPPRASFGFSLLELVITVSIISILAGAVAPSLARRLAKSRDAQRMADMRTIQEAIELFHVDRGRWPAADENGAYGDWDVSHDGGFIAELQRAGFMLDDVGDPLDSDLYHYRYKVFPQGSFGCKGFGSYYVLGVREFETDAYADANSGFFACDGRDFGAEFDYVTGGGATQD
ncbi:MAG: prepilin-type N-terminal cleavage/methylation domain-containing protein [Planctomycetes bacterium]|nr:prepilin-type N-terminal cleavage/methylation domain-containing protein [Planctomycetota bacterium]MCB9903000.1 prepilin-type N-terminal cleavage/methylation domain-containing protein [Planctomycetota bacterium]